MSLATQLQINLAAQLTSVGTLGSANFPLSQIISQALATGTGANKADQLYVAQRTLAASANERLHLAAFGGATDPLGNALALLTVKMILIQNTAALASDALEVGGDNTTGAWVSMLKDKTDIIIIRGGGFILACAPDATGYAVVGTTNELLEVHNIGANSVTYNVYIIGATA